MAKMSADERLLSMLEQDAESIVIFVCMSVHPERNLKAVVNALRGSEQWFEFVELLIDPETLWADVRPLDALAEVFDEKTLRVVLAKHPDWVERAFGAKNVDAYWSKKIRYHIANGDFDRAWDELVKAARGTPRQKHWSDPSYFKASPECLRLLVPELAGAVGDEKLESASGFRISGPTSADKLRGRVLGGLDWSADNFDENFVEKKGGERDKLSKLIRKLTKYFTSRRHERRNTRKERKLKEYETGQK
jgi:hypothetical protein